MGIVAILYLIFWSVILYYFDKEGTAHGLRGQSRLIASGLLTQTGLQFSSMLLTLLTIMISSGAIATDFENGMIHAIISRPLRRSEYVLGKLFGLLILVFGCGTFLFSAILILGAIYSLETIIILTLSQILSSWLLYLFVPYAILCITIYGSTCIKAVPNGLLMIFIYILGNIGGMVEMIGKYIDNQPVVSAGIFISLVSPFHTIFTTVQRVLLPSNGIIGELMSSAGGLSGSGSPPSVWMWVYITIYCLGFLILSIRKFGKTDIV